jgi:hypothetical protein
VKRSGSGGQRHGDVVDAVDDDLLDERGDRVAPLLEVVIVDDGMPPVAGPEPERHALLASGVLRVYVEQPHLRIAGEPAGAVPILPPATIGAAR